MKVFVTALTLFLGVIVIANPVESSVETMPSRYMAFCLDGDGALSEWMVSREDAYLAGRDHERANRGHRWEIWTQDGETTRREAVCARIVAGSKPETVTVGNACGKCLIFLVARTNSDGSVNARELRMKPNTARSFRVPPNSKITVDSERDCPP